MNSGFITPQEAYLLKKNVKELAINKQDKLTAGENIIIDENNVISASAAKSPAGEVSILNTDIGGENSYTVDYDFTNEDNITVYIVTPGGTTQSVLIQFIDDDNNTMTYEAQNAIQTGTTRYLLIQLTNLGEAGYMVNSVQHGGGQHRIVNVGYNNFFEDLTGKVKTMRVYLRGSNTFPEDTSLKIYGI